MELNIYSNIVLFVAIVIGSLDLVIILGSKLLASRAFGFCIFWVTIWIASVGFIVASVDPLYGLLWGRLSYCFGSIISAGFFYFSLTFPDNTKPPPLIKWVLIALHLLLFYFYIFTDFFIYNAVRNGSPSVWSWSVGPVYSLFLITFLGFFIVAIIILSGKYRNSKITKNRKNLQYMLSTIFVGLIPPSITSIILPTFGYFALNWIGAASEIIWIPILSFSIIKYQQMNVRAVVTEVLAIAMTAVFFINIFVNQPLGIWGYIFTFIVFLLLAIYLIRSALREAHQKEQLADLNLHLEQKVAEQTKEIRASYDLEKEARRELEKLNEAKNQFIMITQHHLRTPVTSIEWELESMLAGTYGAVSAEFKEALLDTKTATGRLTRIIDDFLNITALKTGQNILMLSNTSLKEAIESIVSELKTEISRRKISLSYPKNEADWPTLSIDAPKMHDILLIIIENALKYNHDGGSVEINTRTHDGRFELTIKNTGIGITTEEISKIGSALFYRGDDARKLNTVGMGVGISVAKAIIKAHHGTFNIHSEGKDKGAKVTIELPL